jgi:hypothetical protein
MADKLLVFHPNDAEWKKIKQIANAQKIRSERVEHARYMQPLEALAKGQQGALVKAFEGEAPAESLIVMCGFTEKEMDKLLAALKKAQVPIDYKAILTPTNRRWNVLRLLLELGAEKAAYGTEGDTLF